MAEKKSLAASSGALTEAPKFELPALFQEPTEKVIGKFSAPYITFAHKERPDEYAKLIGLGVTVNEGDMFLIEGSAITKLDIAKLSPAKIKQYWVEKDASGKVRIATYTEQPWPWSEHMDAVCLLYLDTRIVVVNISPHTTKCSGFKALADALIDCQKPEWGDKSPAHKETLQINQPFMRFFGEMTVASPRISKKTGRPYRTTQTVIKPVTNVEVKLLKEFAQSEESSKLLKDAADRFTFRMQDIEKLIK